jgi:formate hydrogenlyase subunit 6/NADH:ubiquinone oxidoreductase subunit I
MKKKSEPPSKKKKNENNLYSKSRKYKDLIQTCQFCMKLCRQACPVAEISKSELLTPFGKISAIGQHTGLEENWALTSFECTHCGMCTSYCTHEIPVEALLSKQRNLIKSEHLPEKFITARQNLKSAYSGDIEFPIPEKKSGSVLYWPALGIEKVRHIKSKMPITDYNNYFIQKNQQILEKKISKENLYIAPPRDMGFDLYSAGLTDEFLAYVDSMLDKLKRYDLIIFESGVDLYVLSNIMNRYGKSGPKNIISLWEWIFTNLSGELKAGDRYNEWILWVDPFSGRSITVSDAKEIEGIMEQVKLKNESSLIPENIRRPGIWSEGFYFYSDEDMVREFSKPAIDIINDFSGQIIFTSLRDYQYFQKFEMKNKAFYLTDLVFDSID